MSVQILSGDCLLRLREIDHADTVITDPVWPNCPAGLLAGWDRPQELFAAAVQLLPSSVKRLVVILRSDTDPRFLDAVPKQWPYICLQALPYAVPMYLGRVLGGTEIAYCFGEPVRIREGKRVIPMWGPKAQPRDRPANDHPCSRSLVHMTWLVDWWSERGDTILDPFCGSGTIPLAADHMQRHGIGIEINPDYAAMAQHRLKTDAPLFAGMN